MTQLPPPLTSADADLREFAFMPLDVLRLRDSDLASLSTGDEFRCAVLLWCASWHQVPAGSLPDDDKVLSQLAGFGRVVKEWQKVRDGALRNWIKCEDTRLYHPVVAEKVNEAWAGRVKYAEKKEAERARKAEERRLKKLADEAAQRANEANLQQQIPLAGPELSEGQTEFVQRTSAGSPPENALKETVDSGQWTVDSGQLTAKDSGGGTVPDYDPPRVAPLPVREAPPLSDDPALQLSMFLRRIGVDAKFTHPAVQDWTTKAVSHDILQAAVGIARERKPEPEKIPPGYLVGIVNDLLNPPAAANSTSRPVTTAPPRKPQGTEPKGIDESYADYDARIAAALEKRKGSTP